MSDGPTIHGTVDPAHLADARAIVRAAATRASKVRRESRRTSPGEASCE